MESEGRLHAFGADRRNDGVAGIIPTHASCTDVDMNRRLDSKPCLRVMLSVQDHVRFSMAKCVFCVARRE